MFLMSDHVLTMVSDSSDGNSEVQSVLGTRTAAVLSEHSFRSGMHKASQWWHRCTLPSLQAHLGVPWGPSPTTISKWLFCFPASGSSELAKPTHQKNYHSSDLFICVLFQKANSQLYSLKVEWILPLTSDSPFVLGSPLPLLHLFQEEREVHPRKDGTSVQHISSLCAIKLQHCFMEAKQEESIIVTQG